MSVTAELWSLSRLKIEDIDLLLSLSLKNSKQTRAPSPRCKRIIQDLYTLQAMSLTYDIKHFKFGKNSENQYENLYLTIDWFPCMKMKTKL